MGIEFKEMKLEDSGDIMKIYNYYVQDGTAAFPQNILPEKYYEIIYERIKGYPGYVIKDGENSIGFCYLSPYNPFPTFKSTAVVTFFISKDYVGKGIGTMALCKLEEEAKKIGVSNLIAQISSENEISINFHKKHGFIISGELKNIGYKLGRYFGIISMQKNIDI